MEFIDCPFCGRINNSDWTECQECGAILPTDLVTNGPVELPTSSESYFSRDSGVYVKKWVVATGCVALLLSFSMGLFYAYQNFRLAQELNYQKETHHEARDEFKAKLENITGENSRLQARLITHAKNERSLRTKLESHNNSIRSLQSDLESHTRENSRLQGKISSIQAGSLRGDQEFRERIKHLESEIEDFQSEIEDIQSERYKSTYDLSATGDRMLRLLTTAAADAFLDSYGISRDSLTGIAKYLELGEHNMVEIADLFGLDPKVVIELASYFGYESEASKDARVRRAARSKAMGSRALWSDMKHNKDSVLAKYGNEMIDVIGTLMSVEIDLKNNRLQGYLIQSPSMTADIRFTFPENQRIEISRYLGKDIVISARLSRVSNPLELFGALPHVDMLDARVVE